ncbi:hypothetical protein Bbelb_013040 [Branchiostoma belcheri]|nr:hypothetical protein Bbelb_013040 [Branchiostoma belcheri]
MGEVCVSKTAYRMRGMEHPVSWHTEASITVVLAKSGRRQIKEGCREPVNDSYIAISVRLVLSTAYRMQLGVRVPQAFCDAVHGLCITAHGGRRPGRPPLTYPDVLRRDVGLRAEDMGKAMEDRDYWAAIVVRVAEEEWHPT